MKNDILIRDMPKDTRPYERCVKYGCGSLSDSELLAVILRTGTKNTGVIALADRILSLHTGKSDVSSLTQLSYEDLTSVDGVGDVKAAQILCTSELAKRIAKTRALAGIDFSRPTTVADYYMEDMRHLKREKLIVVFLNSKCRMIGDCTISVGTVNRSLMAPREIFIEALKRNAVGLVALHNHPSGDPTPSREDITSTKRIVDAGKLIGITVLDHIIIGDNIFVSFKEQGILY